MGVLAIQWVMRKLLTFYCCVAGLTTSKLWHDTLRIFLTAYIPNCNRAILEPYLSWNATGVLMGGIMAGLVTDSLTPKKVFPFATGSICLLSFLLIGCFQYEYLNIPLWLKLGLVMTRGIFIAIAMNCAYVAVGNLYKNNTFLPTASNYLYMILFGTLAFAPLIIDKLPTKPAFMVFAGLMGILTLVLIKAVEKTEVQPVNISKYFKSWPLLITRPEFLLTCFVSMICIGGFYNLVYIFTDANLKLDYINNVSMLQSAGRQFTFGVLACIYLLNIKFMQTSKDNCAQYMSVGMGIVSLGALILLFLHLNLPLGMPAEIIFLICCICTGFAQPAAKLAIISVSQKLGKNITGSAQSFVTLFNSLIEQQGVKLIMAYSYPGGARAYLVILTLLAGLVSTGLYLRRKKINNYIS